MNVVVFKLNSLGDNIVFLPAIQEIRRRFPEWRITLVTTPLESELYGGALRPQELVVCGKSAFTKAYRRPWRVLLWTWRIRRERPAACLIPFDQSNVAHFVAKHSGARIRVGGNLVRIRVRGSLTVEISLPEDLRPVTWNWRMAGALVRTEHPGADWPEAPPAPDLRHLLVETVPAKGTRKRVIIHPGAGQTLNQWDFGRFAAVATSLAQDFDVAWVSHGRTLGTQPAGTTAVNPKSLAQLASWIASADLFLGNNSGPMHLANALGVNGVAVTGPTTTGWNPYWHPERWTILRHPSLPCSPCEITQVALERCTNLQSPMACMAYWTHGMVEAACRKRLAEKEADR